MKRFLLFAAASLVSVLQCHTAEPVFSGPQRGERITGFKVAQIDEAAASSIERDPVSGSDTRPVNLVFVHALERSLVPLLRVVDEYGARRKDHLRTEVIFLADDRITGESRVKAAKNSLRLKSNVGLSVDGAEGPGNYGLSKECMMTLVLAKENKVTDNFALVQPGIADAPQVLAALAKISGDANPPKPEELLPQQARAMRGEAARERMENRGEGKEPFPGAVPTDEKLTGLLRRFIRPTNDDAAVDRILEEVKAHIKDDPALKKQAIDGWTRVLHFGDRYGTAYSRKIGAEFLQSLEKDAAAKGDEKR